MSSKAKAIMFQGTGSGVGKSIVVAALCRILARKGIKVTPFKAQNMALNSFVTHDGLEMGRAQVFQAEACGLEPDVRMNPVLLKPSADARSQVILMGKPTGHYSAKNYYKKYKSHREVARRAYDSLAEEYDVIVMEGAGSPAEINLQQTDIVNMQMAEYSSAKVILVGDIDRGGVFAWLKGTFDLVQNHHRNLIAGYLINKFRGDVGLLMPGIEQFKDISSMQCLGVLPWFYDITVDQEDGVFVNALHSSNGPVNIAVIHLPRISNFTDFAPLAFEKDVSLSFVRTPEELTSCDCLIIPGTKATIADLSFLHQKGWDDKIASLVANDKVILGICGGYQMLGKEIQDKDGIEGCSGSFEGLGLLPVITEMKGSKKLSRTKITFDSLPFAFDKPVEATGYEIHMGRTWKISAQNSHPEGESALVCSNDNATVIGTYLHGLFENDELRRNFIDFLRNKKGLEPIKQVSNYQQFRQEQFDKLADWMEANSDMEMILELVGLHR